MISAQSHIEETSFRIPTKRAWVDADLSIPEHPKGLVVFVNGDGATRHNARERILAAFLNEGGYASMMTDLLTVHERPMDDIGDIGHDATMLAQRLIETSEWLTWNRSTANMPTGYFGAGTGAAAALMAAGALPTLVQAVVCRSGRLDLAEAKALAELKAPTLLIVGSRDESLVDINRSALTAMSCERAIEIIPGAGHRFDEKGSLSEVAGYSLAWFQRHLGG